MGAEWIAPNLNLGESQKGGRDMWWQRFTPVAGVGLIVINRSQVLLIREKGTKEYLGKRAGMVSFPMETCEKGESPLETMGRLLQEEVPGIAGRINLQLSPSGLYQVITGVWLLVYWALMSERCWPFVAVGSDVEDPHWVPLRQAVRLSNLRRGAKEALSDRLMNRRQVICPYCEIPLCLRQLELHI